MVLGEIIVEGIAQVGSGVHHYVEVGFGPMMDGKTAAQILFKDGPNGNHAIAVTVDRQAAQRLIAALALALPRLD